MSTKQITVKSDTLDDVWLHLKLHCIPQMIMEKLMDYFQDENYNFDDITADIEESKESRIKEFCVEQLNDTTGTTFDLLVKVINNIKNSIGFKSQKVTQQQLNKCNQYLLMLIEGYIRTLKHYGIIPLDIIYLCYQFHSMSAHKFILNKQNKLISLNITNKSISTSDIIEINTSLSNTKSLCFIPNISSLVSLSNDFCPIQHYDGLLQQTQSIYTISYNLALFDQFEETDKIIDNISTINCHNLMSSKTCSARTAPDSFIFCGAKYGIIGALNGNLYQLKLQDISSNNFQFEELNVSNINNSKFWGHWKMKLEMDYMSSIQKIFSIQCDSGPYRLSGSVTDRYDSDGQQWIKCGLFDFEKNEWNEAMSFEYNSEISDYFACCICHDKNEENIYMVTEGGITAKYNLNKNQWIELYNNEHDEMMLFDAAPRIWFDEYDANTLFCGGDQDNIVFRYFDIRENKQQWTVIPTIALYKELSANKLI